MLRTEAVVVVVLLCSIWNSSTNIQMSRIKINTAKMIHKINKQQNTFLVLMPFNIILFANHLAIFNNQCTRSSIEGYPFCYAFFALVYYEYTNFVVQCDFYATKDYLRYIIDLLWKCFLNAFGLQNNLSLKREG